MTWRSSTAMPWRYSGCCHPMERTLGVSEHRALALEESDAMVRGVELLDRLAARTCDVVNETSLWYSATERVAD
jgi:hypothetical protein